jgi:uncharacterized membrane protein YbhN (UPF0104 family)
MIRTKVRKTYNLVIQLTILLLTYFFIYREVFEKTDMQRVFHAVRENWSSSEFANMMFLILFLMFVNWGIESGKWKYMIGKIEKVGFFKSFYAVLAGVAVSSFTPNRIGEYFGRVFVLDRASRFEGTLITILGSMSQLIVTLLTGSAGLLIFIPFWPGPHSFINGYLFYILVAIVILFNMMVVGLFLNISFLSSLREKILKTRLKRLRKFFRVFAFYHSRELLTILGLSFLRYLVFASQFYFLLRLFLVPVPYPEALMIISMIYFVMALIPTVLITELGIRGSISLYFFGIYFSGGNVDMDSVNFGVFAASTLLWLINVGFPAVIGSLFVFRLHFFRKNATNISA